MFTVNVLRNFTKINQPGTNTPKRTGWFTTPISTKPEISNLTNNNFIKLGDTYYNPRYIKSIKINDTLVEMRVVEPKFTSTVIFDDQAVQHVTNLMQTTEIVKEDTTINKPKKWYDQHGNKN